MSLWLCVYAIARIDMLCVSVCVTCVYVLHACVLHAHVYICVYMSGVKLCME